MKKIIIILDGIADRPCRQLNGKTPLEIAKKPNLDFFAKNSILGFMYPLKENIAPESDSAITSILGYKPFIESRGVLEAIGENINFSRGDLILRTNFASIDNLENKKIIDRRAGRNLMTKEIKELEKTINTRINLPYKFEFHATSQHRGILMINGGFSDNISNTDPEYGTNIVHSTQSAEPRILNSKPLDDDDNSKLSANLINNFTEQTYKILNEHQININRKNKGLMPANVLLLRDAGIEKPKFQKIKGKWIAFAHTPLIKGIAKSTGMKLSELKIPEMKKIDFYEYQQNLLKSACKKAKKTISKNFKKYDNFLIHFIETDLPGHDNKPQEKVKMIEIIDNNFISFLKKYKDKAEIIITSDHATPCSQKKHAADPVPLLVYRKKQKQDKKKDKKKEEGQKTKQQKQPQLLKDHTDAFTEKEALLGKLGKVYGKDFIKKILEL